MCYIFLTIGVAIWVLFIKICLTLPKWLFSLAPSLGAIGIVRRKEGAIANQKLIHFYAITYTNKIFAYWCENMLFVFINMLRNFFFFRCTTIRCITSTNVVSPRVLLDEKKIYSLAGDVVNLLLEMRFDKHPIYFHTFSNGGATVYRYVSEIMRKKHSELFKVYF